MSFPAYESYKESGVEWLGRVPSHWNFRPLKHLVIMRSGGTPSKEREDYWGGEIPWASAKDLKVDTLTDTQDHLTAEALDEGAAQLLPANAVVVLVRGMMLARTFPVCRLSRPMTINQDLKGLIANRGVDPNYLAWSLRASEVETLCRLDEAGHGTKALRMDAWSTMELPAPSLAEQQAIAAFLDRETAKIDALVEAQERLIALLKEKRQAVISHAVTKGLDPSAQMKDSGVEWLGQMPAHWEVVPAKNLADSIKAGPFGSALTKDMYSSAGYRVYGQEQVIPGDFRIGDYYVTSDRYNELSQYRVEVGDLLVSCVGTFGKIAIFPQGAEPGIINPRLIRFRPNNQVDPTYLCVLLRSAVSFEQFSYLSRGGTMDVINIGILGEIVVPVPPMQEQISIAGYLAEVQEQFDSLSAASEAAITLLQERRAALISAAVTGKIDVRGLVQTAEAA
ncbi:restriction endonuclease subunit S [Caulobacter vibrioides]|uniref:Type I restriction-modification system, S subunit n=2 Tax=Caulobacter vibrioides TaxID=155892 RepID=Q9AAH7_CAUVC|nr:restriction endonuclease subunit S [Caulobacter vibrioides]YP_002516030.1 type I restriction-modification system specificity subunit [Caulobacter vibrioides NA1000]AAK22606.1 type I restriction-modification system, S subunit [Caulobacter vibrioides CB15]ACL94122.1 type I restriction-modification system specificity subunit [Caulobacter vibrioides NA1000]ATC27466.1 restriction endonuclease subunit S [Caulobacter vibrioides]AZH11843.1 restriction endonuclease subunit S [Caulobacter vibrioides]